MIRVDNTIRRHATDIVMHSDVDEPEDDGETDPDANGQAADGEMEIDEEIGNQLERLEQLEDGANEEKPKSQTGQMMIDTTGDKKK